MSAEDTQAGQSEELATLPPALRERFEVWFDQVPESDADEATLRIVEQIFMSESAEELDMPWRGEGLRQFLGRLVQVQGIRRLPSDFQAGPGWYLGVDVVLDATGEKTFTTTGSIAVMAQLVTAYLKDMLPLAVVPRQAERPSRNGYFPMHLEIARER